MEAGPTKGEAFPQPRARVLATHGVREHLATRNAAPRGDTPVVHGGCRACPDLRTARLRSSTGLVLSSASQTFVQHSHVVRRVERDRSKRRRQRIGAHALAKSLSRSEHDPVGACSAQPCVVPHSDTSCRGRRIPAGLRDASAVRMTGPRIRAPSPLADPSLVPTSLCVSSCLRRTETSSDTSARRTERRSWRRGRRATGGAEATNPS